MTTRQRIEAITRAENALEASHELGGLHPEQIDAPFALIQDVLVYAEAQLDIDPSTIIERLQDA